MKTLRHAACVLLAAISFIASPAYATKFTTDQSDLWFNINEQGEGVQLVQRGWVIFATLFVYGPGGLPTWYTATMDPTSNATWTGTLYATTGTYFGNPWNPAAFTILPVGTMTWQALFVPNGLLTWDVNGVPGTLTTLTRQTLVLDDYSGHYAGYVHREFNGCPANNGVSEVERITDITQNGTAISILETFPATGGSCTFTGTVSEFGQMGEFDGSFACTDGSAGTSEWFEVQVTIAGLSNRDSVIYSNPPGCQNLGYFAGARVTTF